MSTIPASVDVNVTPSVLSAGGSALDMNGMVLTNGARVPIGTVVKFTGIAAVKAYFGPTSPEAIFAGGGADMGSGYFGGFDNSNKKPGAILFAPYNETDAPAWLRGGNLSAMTVAQLQATSGSISLSIDGANKTATPNLATATSFSNAGLIIAAALGIEGAQAASFTASIAAGVLTASAVPTGQIAVGQVIHGVGVTAGTYITSLGTGTGGPGTYNVSVSQTVASEAMTSNAPAVTFDPISTAFVVSSGTVGDNSTITYATGNVASALKLNQAGGAVISPGADAQTPAGFMARLTQISQNWAGFATTFDPDALNSTGFQNKLAFSAWTNGSNDRYVYVALDTDPAPTVSLQATGSYGYALSQAGYGGTSLNWSPTDMNHAAFVLGSMASIDFSQTDGRTTFKFLRQGGLVAAASDETVRSNLLANGYNFYGAYATANDDFIYYAAGSVSGEFDWLDSYVNEIWLNNNIQLALLTLMLNVRAIAYNTAGYGKIEAALSDVIEQALTFGVFRGGVTLSSSQISQVNASAGRNIASTLSTRGWYLQILDASPTVRQARGSPPMTFWYVDGQAVQSIELASIAVQ